MLDKKLLLQHIQNRFRTVEEQNQIAESSRGLKRTERVLGAMEKKAVQSGKNPETMSAKPEGEYAQRGRAFQLRQTDVGRERKPGEGGTRDAGGERRDPLRPHGSGRIGTGSRTYMSSTYKTPSQKAAEANPEKAKAIQGTDQRIRNLSDKITSYKPEEVAKRQPRPDQPTGDKPTGIRDKVKGMAGKIKSALMGEEIDLAKRERDVKASLAGREKQVETASTPQERIKASEKRGRAGVREVRLDMLKRGNKEAAAVTRGTPKQAGDNLKAKIMKDLGHEGQTVDQAIAQRKAQAMARLKG